jgi:PRTRC genetic system protein B
MNIESPSLSFSSDSQRGFSLKRAVYFYEDYQSTVLIKSEANSDGELQTGVPVSAIDLAQALTVELSSTEIAFNPDTLLQNTHDSLVWYSKAQAGPMHFIQNGGHRSLKVQWPALLWKVNKRSKSVYIAAIANRRPTLQSKLYHAPLMNIDGRGMLCLGNAELPEVTQQQVSTSLLKEIESCVRDTNFTHTNHSLTLKGGASCRSQYKFWKAKASSRDSVKISELEPMARTINQFIHEIRG